MHPSVDQQDVEKALDQAAAWLQAAERVAVLTGAGISAESGVPTFRGAGGLWEGHRVEEVATPFAFQRAPDVVWHHEMLPEDVWQEALGATAECQCFLVVGTSAIVYPAAGLIAMARGQGARVIEVNLDSTAASTSADLSLYGPSGLLLPRLVEK